AAAAQRSRRIITVLIVVVVALALALAAVAVTAMRSGEGEHASAPSPTPTSSRPPGDPLPLPTGAEEVNGLPTGFERTPEGAVAMAVAYLTHDVTLDVENRAEARVMYYAELQGKEAGKAEKKSAATQIQLDLGTLGIAANREDLP